ncbi:MAG TPA: DUF3592 domain-containing protein [Anaerohalosphaeraceae bacterium]|nr:DUF3592 domain-containing protein [Anaerohalosphaeraceae bacterium]
MRLQFRHHKTCGCDSHKPDSVAGRLFASVFFLFFGGMGLLFEVFLVREVVSAIHRRNWSVVSCRILESSVRQESNSESPYRFAVKYEYQVNGATYQSTRYQFKDSGSGDYAKMQKLADRYQTGLQTQCYVNPTNPSQAILEQDSLGIACFILIPTVFVIVGAGGIYGTWFYKPKPKTQKFALPEAKGKTGKSQWGLLLFGFVFFAAGSGFSYIFLIRPMLDIVRARTWIETPCTILSGQVLSHDSDDGTTYSIDILYEYVVDDKEYRSNRYDFMSGSSSGYQGKREVVDKYLKLKNTICYVNPESPGDAVLNRDLTWKYAIGLFPLIFVAVGLAVMIGAVIGMKRRAAKESIGGWKPQTAFTSSHQSGYQQHYGQREDKIALKPQKHPIAMLLFPLLFCGFWNGLLSFFVYEVFSGFKTGRPDWCLTLFMIPFVLVGIGTVVWVIYQFLALFNPRFEIAIQPASLCLGGNGQLQWTVHGRAGRIRKLVLTLTAREEVVNTDGEGSSTHRKLFYEKELLSTTLRHEMKTGQVHFAIPQRTMHSFETEHNKIIWAINVKADIPLWPDVKQEYQFFVGPQPVV